MKPSIVDELGDMGFRGLKTIRPLENYDSKSYYPFYERAEARNMPILFHTGQLFRAPGSGSRAEDVSTARMMPWMLDPIARAFPKLTLIGAHLRLPFICRSRLGGALERKRLLGPERSNHHPIR